MLERPILFNKPEIDDLVRDGYDVVAGPILLDGHQHSLQDIEDEIKKYCKSKQFDTVIVYQRAYTPKPNRNLHESVAPVPKDFKPVDSLTASVVYALKEIKKSETGKLK
jgi:hypothetical protein